MVQQRKRKEGQAQGQRKVQQRQRLRQLREQLQQQQLQRRKRQVQSTTGLQLHSLSAVSMPAKWSEHPCKCTRSALYPCQPNGKNTLSSALAQHCIHASQKVRTPVQVHSLSTVSMPAKWIEHPFKRNRSALYRSALFPCQPNGQNTRSSALAQHCIHASQMPAKWWSEHPCKCTRSALFPCQPNGQNTRASALAQHCIHASQIVRTPVQVHSLSTVSMPAIVRTPVQAHSLSTVSLPAKWSEHPFKCNRLPAKWSEHPCKCTRSALFPCQPNGKNTRSSALAQHCIHANQMVRTPVQAHSLSTVSMPAKWSEHPCKCTHSPLYPCQPNGKNTRASALAQHCIHASQMVRTPVQAHSLSTVSMPAK